MFPVGPGSSVASNFLLQLRPVAAKNLSIMVRALPDRLIRPARALPIDVPPRPAPREELLVLPALKERRRVRLVLAVLAVLVVRGELNAREVFPVQAARPVPVDRGVVPVARPVRVDLVAAPVVQAAHPVPG